MRKYIILVGFLVAVYGTYAQLRQPIVGFSQFQAYSNPALTGFAGSSIQGFYRDPWTGTEGAPQTAFLSGELNLADMKGMTSESLQHAFGVMGSYDAYGLSTDRGLAANYALAYPVSPALQLRAGISLTYASMRAGVDDGLVPDVDGDPALEGLRTHNTWNKFAANFGVALTGADFYAGYAVGDLVTSGNSGLAYFSDRQILQHMVQAGYRRVLAGAFGLVVNGIFRYDQLQKGIAEGQLKGVYSNRYWIGAGYRDGLAYTVSAGLAVSRFRLGYSREIALPAVNGFYRGTNEITLGYHFFGTLANGQRLSIW